MWPGEQSACAQDTCLSTGNLWKNNVYLPVERPKIGKDARACTGKDVSAFMPCNGNGQCVDMLRRTTPRIMSRRLIVVAEARLQAQIHKQAEQNKVRRCLSQFKNTAFAPTITNTTHLRLPSTGSRDRNHRLHPKCPRTIRWASPPH